MGWKPARTICLTVKRESNPPTKLVRVALGPKKGATLFCVNQDFQSVWKQVLGSGAEGGQAREMMLWEL